MADPEILEMFYLKFTEGSLKDALNDPSAIVLTEQMAARFFPVNENRLGKEIQSGGQKYYVSGVVKDLPRNSHIKVDCFMPLQGTWVADDNSKGWRGVSIYALFGSNKDAQLLQAKLLDFQVRFREGDLSRDEIVESGDYTNSIL